MDYAPGMRVIIRDEEWKIKKVEKNTMGVHALHCIGITPLVKNRNVIFLDDIEKDNIILVDPSATTLRVDESSSFVDTLLYIESQWRQKIPTDNKIYVGNKAAMDTMNYQLEPAQMALNQPRQRMLIADAVGLGKTLEAGILMSELILRGKGKRILVVTSKAMMGQFQKEMWNRFTIPLVRLDSNKIRQIRAKLPATYNPFFYYDKTIISIDTLKNDVVYRTHLEHAYWDIIVIDEAQSVATRGDRKAQRAKLAELLANRSDTMIMLSATPHDGKARSFASLMNMLDPTAIANPDDYTSEDIKGLFIRRFKKDVKDQMGGVVLDRKLSEERCQATEAEERVYDTLSSLELDMDTTHKKGMGQLFRTSLEKALFSSPAACMKTVKARLTKLRKKYNDNEIKDIKLLEGLYGDLGKITTDNFSRYQKLLQLINSKEYGWGRKADDDRIVIFTERIDTMDYLYEQLSKDLKLNDKEIAKISGAMSDEQQQEIVENFGRAKSKVRILVASDVASEGLNLHYMSHRLIHFDLPWSLMVFQQRNGRIDRYGQTKQPDIRYLFTETINEKISGDMRLLQILIEKEEQALKNIGDPAILLGCYGVEEEEAAVSDAIEQGKSAADFGQMMDNNSNDFNPFDLLLSGAMEETPSTPQISDNDTLYSDTEYLYQAMKKFNQSEEYPVSKMPSVRGVEITMSDEIKNRLQTLWPTEVAELTKNKSFLRFVSDKEYCMQEVRRCYQEKSDNIWPEVQYLWPLNPVFDYINDKAGLLFDRSEAPLAVINGLAEDTCIFLMNGSIPNRKSTPLVDEWIGLIYKQGKYIKTVSFQAALNYAHVSGRNELPNQVDRETHYKGKKEKCQALVGDAVTQAKKHLDTCYGDYQQRIEPQISEELNKLAELETKHLDYQLTLFANKGQRKQDEKQREVRQLFDEFETWVNDSMTIENHPYIRVIAVFTGTGEGNN